MHHHGIRFLSLVWHGGVVQEDAHLTIVASFVPERVLDLRLFASGRTSEVIVAHGNGNSLLELDLMVVVHTVRKALAAIDRKATVLSIAVDSLAAHEIGHRLLGRRPELVVDGYAE